MALFNKKINAIGVNHCAPPSQCKSLYLLAQVQHLPEMRRLMTGFLLPSYKRTRGPVCRRPPSSQRDQQRRILNALTAPIGVACTVMTPSYQYRWRAVQPLPRLRASCVDFRSLERPLPHDCVPHQNWRGTLCWW